MPRRNTKGPSQIFVEAKRKTVNGRDGKPTEVYECKQKLYVADGYGITLDLSNLCNKTTLVTTKYGTEGIYVKFWPNYPKDYVSKARY